MKIEFKVPEYNHKELFEALSDMLNVLGRQATLNTEVCAIMNSSEEDLPDVVNKTYILDGFQIEFLYYKLTGKISVTSRRVQ